MKINILSVFAHPYIITNFLCLSMECKRGFVQEWPVFDTFMQIFVYFGA